MRMNLKSTLGLALVFAVCSTATVWAGAGDPVPVPPSSTRDQLP